MCVCLPVLHALASSAWNAWPLTYPLVNVGEGTERVCVCAWQRDRQAERKRRRATARLDACCHMLSYTCWCIASRRIRTHNHTRINTHIYTRTQTGTTLTHLASQEAVGPVGQSKLESLVCLFTSNYRNRTISATTAPAFYIERERGRESKVRARGEKKKLWQPFLTIVNGYLIPSELLQSAGSQYSTAGGRGGGSCIVFSHPHVTWMCKCTRSKRQKNKTMYFPH